MSTTKKTNGSKEKTALATVSGAGGSSGVGRRELIRLIGGAATVLASQPGCKSDTAPPSVFAADERAALSAFADVIIPPDHEPGGAGLGAVGYIERFVGVRRLEDHPADLRGRPVLRTAAAAG